MGRHLLNMIFPIFYTTIGIIHRRPCKFSPDILFFKKSFSDKLVPHFAGAFGFIQIDTLCQTDLDQ